MATLKISDLSVGDWVQDMGGNYAYAIVSCSFDKLAAAVILAIGAFADFGWFAPRQQAQRLPQRRTIGKEHRGMPKAE